MCPENAKKGKEEPPEPTPVPEPPRPPDPVPPPPSPHPAPWEEPLSSLEVKHSNRLDEVERFLREASKKVETLPGLRGFLADPDSDLPDFLKEPEPTT